MTLSLRFEFTRDLDESKWRRSLSASCMTLKRPLKVLCRQSDGSHQGQPLEGCTDLEVATVHSIGSFPAFLMSPPGHRVDECNHSCAR